MMGHLTYKGDLDKAGCGCGDHDVHFRANSKGSDAQTGIDSPSNARTTLQSCPDKISESASG